MCFLLFEKTDGADLMGATLALEVQRVNELL